MQQRDIPYNMNIPFTMLSNKSSGKGGRGGVHGCSVYLPQQLFLLVLGLLAAPDFCIVVSCHCHLPLLFADLIRDLFRKLDSSLFPNIVQKAAVSLHTPIPAPNVFAYVKALQL